MDRPTRPPNTMPFVEPAFYVDPRQLALITIQAAKAQAQTLLRDTDTKQPTAKQD